MYKGRKFSRQSAMFKISICEHFAKYKWFYLILGSVCLAGLIIGFFVGFNRAENLKLDDLPDSVLLSYINKEIANTSVFFSRVFSFLGILILVWVTNCKPFLCFITFITILYRAFLIGINCSILIILYQVGGVINVVLIFLPVHLIVLFALLVWSSICLYSNFANKNLGYNILSVDFIRCKKTTFLIVVIIAVCAYALETILLPYLTSAVFIGVN